MKQINVVFILFSLAVSLAAQNIWLNEFHYDNVGTDEGEFIEVVLEDAGTYTLSDFTITLYNGNGCITYDSKTLDLFTVGITSENFTLYYYEFPGGGIQNGAPDGIAIDYQGTLIPGQFLSYEGTFTAVDGPANGVTSVDIGVSEPGEIGESLQLMGDGSSYPDFIWQPPALETPGNLNINQTIGGTPQPMIIVVSPNGGEEWEQGSTHDITWISINFTDNVKIELEMVYERTREVLVASTENDGVWEWNIPIDQTISDWYVIIISDAIDGDPMDQSDDTFSIIEQIPAIPLTIYQIQYTTDPSGASPYEGERVETSGVVTAKFADYFFIQDGIGTWNGIAVYPIQDVEVGDEILIVAYVAEYNEKTELTDIVSLEIVGLADVPEPVVITTNDLAIMEDYEGVMVKVQDVTVTNEDLGYGEWEIDDGSGPCRVDDLGEYTYVPVLDDFLYSIIGVVDYTYGNFKLEPRNDDDLNITGLEVYPNTILFLTNQACMGKDFTISNFSEEDIIINNINNEGWSVFAWYIDPWTLTFPYTLNPGELLDLTVKVNFPTRCFERDIVTDTIFVETDVGLKKVTLYFDTDLYSSTDDNTISTENTLIGNYPNPFKPSTTISFELNTENTEDTELIVYNLKGQKVKTLMNEKLEAGKHIIIWDGTDQTNKPVSSGIYFYKLTAGSIMQTKKMILIK